MNIIKKNERKWKKIRVFYIIFDSIIVFYIKILGGDLVYGREMLVLVDCYGGWGEEEKWIFDFLVFVVSYKIFLGNFLGFVVFGFRR